MIDTCSFPASSSASVPLVLDGFPSHSRGETFLIAAVLTPVSLPFVDHTILIFSAVVLKFFSDRPLEETLAALAGVNPIVLTRGPVSANRAVVFGG